MSSNRRPGTLCPSAGGELAGLCLNAGRDRRQVLVAVDRLLAAERAAAEDEGEYDKGEDGARNNAKCSLLLFHICSEFLAPTHRVGCRSPEFRRHDIARRLP